MRKEDYEQPTVESIEMRQESALCTSAENFGGTTEQP